MQSVSIPFALSLAALVCGGSIAAQSDIKDSVLLTNGKRIRGVEVTEMSAQNVKWKRGDELDERRSASVSGVTWHEAPEALALGRAAMKAGKFADAVSMFETAASEASRDFVKQECSFLAALAMLRASAGDATKSANSAAKFREFLSSAGESYWAAEAQLELGNAELAAGNAAAAETALTALSQVAASRGLPAVWDIRAKFAIARAQLAQDKLSDARSSFRRTKNAAESALALAGGKDPEIASIIAQSVVGEGETFIAEKKFDDADRYFRGLENNKNTGIAAAARAGRGQALYLAAEASGKKDDLRQAQLLLARATIMDPMGGATSAKAMYYSGKVLLLLGAERSSQDFQVRANEYFRTVAESYTDTMWATRAASELK